MDSSSASHRLRVLFVDDESSIRDVMQLELPRMGHEVVVCEDGSAAVAALDKHTFDAALIDLRMPGLDGWQVVEHLKTVSRETEFVIITGHGNMDEAIQAIRRGAYDFLPKPCKLFEIANVLQRIGDKLALKNKALALEGRLKAIEDSSNLIGETPSMQRVKTLIEKVAPTDSTVMILGETGTGKELVARRIHDLSTRADAPFVAVNCGALPEHLVESEFFGHRKGAFTGAETSRKGLFEVAHGGTLFLDEVGELDRAMQVKLLRFLESGEVRRVGENESFHLDVRILCATNRDLAEMVRERAFREDLYFRVNTFEIHLPPLRDRKEDVPALARFLIARHLKRPNVPEDVLSPEALEALLAHNWNGNVRELANALEHAVILAEGKPIGPEDLPASVTRSAAWHLAGNTVDGATAGLTGSAGATRERTPGSASRAIRSQPKTLREIEMEVIFHVLEKHGGDKRKTAEELGIALKTLYNKLNQHQTQRAAG